MLGSQMRPGGIAAHQQRPVQSSLRPPSSAPNTQPGGSQVSVNVFDYAHFCIFFVLA